MEKEMTHAESVASLQKESNFRGLLFAEKLNQPLQITELCFRLFMGTMFFVAGAMKVGDPAKFQQDILNYHLVPHVVAAAAALYLPWLEMFCAVALVLRKLYNGALAILSGLMVIFFIGYLQAIARGIDLSCGCFGKLSESAPPWMIISRDVVFLASLGLLWFLGMKNSSAKTGQV